MVQTKVGTILDGFDANGKEEVSLENCLLHNAGFSPDPIPDFWDPGFGCAGMVPYLLANKLEAILLWVSMARSERAHSVLGFGALYGRSTHTRAHLHTLANTYLRSTHTHTHVRHRERTSVPAYQRARHPLPITCCCCSPSPVQAPHSPPSRASTAASSRTIT